LIASWRDFMATASLVPFGARDRPGGLAACEVMGDADAGVAIAAMLQRSDPIKRPGTVRARRLT